MEFTTTLGQKRFEECKKECSTTPYDAETFFVVAQNFDFDHKRTHEEMKILASKFVSKDEIWSRYRNFK